MRLRLLFKIFFSVHREMNLKTEPHTFLSKPSAFINCAISFKSTNPINPIIIKSSVISQDFRQTKNKCDHKQRSIFQNLYLYFFN